MLVLVNDWLLIELCKYIWEDLKEGKNFANIGSIGKCWIIKYFLMNISCNFLDVINVENFLC